MSFDYDDGVVAWINGAEVYRTPEMPSGTLAWDTQAGSHESSNDIQPNYAPPHDISSVGIPALQAGTNVLAVGVWNHSSSSKPLSLLWNETAKLADSVAGSNFVGPCPMSVLLGQDTFPIRFDAIKVDPHSEGTPVVSPSPS